MVGASEDQSGVDDYTCHLSHEGSGEASSDHVGMDRFVSEMDSASRIFSESDLIPNGSGKRCGNGFQGGVVPDDVITKVCVFRGSISSEDPLRGIIRPIPPSPDRMAGDCSTTTSDIDNVDGIDDDSPTSKVKDDDLQIDSPSSSTIMLQ